MKILNKSTNKYRFNEPLDPHLEWPHESVVTEAAHWEVTSGIREIRHNSNNIQKPPENISIQKTF